MMTQFNLVWGGRMKKNILFALFVILAPSVSFSGPSPYADCGIGQIWDNKFAASSSNLIWDLGATALTSATSSPETCKGHKVQTAKLILETLPELEKDVALGEGKYLVALAEVMGCDKTLQGKINRNLRTFYADTVNDKAYGNKAVMERATDMYNSAKMAIESIPNSCKAVL